MKALWGYVAMVAVAVALAPTEVSAGTASVEPVTQAGMQNDLLTGLLIALGCALFSVVLRRLPSR